MDFDETSLKGMHTMDYGRGGKGCVIETRMPNQSTVVLDIHGVMDAACNSEMTLRLRDAIDKSKNVLLNLSDLLHMDTEGAGSLAIFTSGAHQKHLIVAACGLNNSFRDVFRLTRLDEAIALFDNEKEALQSLSFSEKIVRSIGTSPHYQGPLIPGWARSVERLSLRDIPAEVININVEGRQTTSPVKGFGRLWDKRYQLRVKDINLEPQEIISLWKSEFPSFWPTGNRFFPSGKSPIIPGTAAVLNLTLPGGLVLATGLMVIYADETSFSFITIQGHILSGWITFGSFKEKADTIIQVNPIFRASDPLMEICLRFGAAKQEDQFWHKTLGNLGRRLGVQGDLSQQDVLIDPHIQWREYKNLWYSAAVRSSFYMPFYMLKKMVKFQ
jgi:anti-anti-sigma factor